MIVRILKFILRKLDKKETRVQYKIGNVKHHNTRIDGLMPQFVEIGDNFVSAPGSIILSHDSSTLIHKKKIRAERTIVGNNVFLGANAIIMPGITVGDNAIVGAGSIVTRDVSPGIVVAGNPAKRICSVEEYIRKCNERKVLYDVPESFVAFFKHGKQLTQNDRLEFQKNVIMLDEK